MQLRSKVIYLVALFYPIFATFADCLPRYPAFAVTGAETMGRAKSVDTERPHAHGGKLI